MFRCADMHPDIVYVWMQIHADLCRHLFGCPDMHPNALEMNILYLGHCQDNHKNKVSIIKYLNNFFLTFKKYFWRYLLIWI